jgi:hypothetical protein
MEESKKVIFTFFRKKVTMKSFIIGLIVLLGISSYADAQFVVHQQRYYNNGYRNNYNNNNYNYSYSYNNGYGYNNGYNNSFLYGQNNNWNNNGFNRYVTPSGYRPFNNPYFRMATQGIGGYGW